MKEYKKPTMREFDIMTDNILIISTTDDNFDLDNGGYDEVWE